MEILGSAKATLDSNTPSSMISDLQEPSSDDFELSCAPTWFILASPIRFQFASPSGKLSNRLRKSSESSLTIQISQPIHFPHSHLVPGTILVFGLPLKIQPFDITLFRTSSGIYSLGCRVHSHFVNQMKNHHSWILLPADGLEITGVVEKILYPQI